MAITTNARQTIDTSAQQINSPQGELVQAKINQGYTTNINVRLVPGRDFTIPTIKKCAPRGNKTPGLIGQLTLPGNIMTKLQAANTKMVAWLAESPTNAKLFMDNPALALSKAGMDFTRAELKIIARTHQQVRDAATVAPGVIIEKFSPSAVANGRVGDSIKPSGTPGRNDNDCGCGEKGK